VVAQSPNLFDLAWPFAGCYDADPSAVSRLPRLAVFCRVAGGGDAGGGSAVAALRGRSPWNRRARGGGGGLIRAGLLGHVAW